jgi:CRISPR-associated exonuclease Cas4
MGYKLENDETLLISGIQHFAFCRRRWALIYIEQLWADNVLTVAGELMHNRAHNPNLTEKRGDLIVARDMPVFSRGMGVRGACDVVEFRRDDAGVTIFGRDGLWLPCPVEYKRGKLQLEANKLQLCAQAMCLEEMLACHPIQEAFIFHGETKRRETVELSEDLRKTVRSMFAEMRGYYERRYTPRVKATKACANCSLKDVCLPKLPQKGAVASYIQNALAEDDSSCANC